MPLASIAEIVGVPVGTVKSRLHYGTLAMRKVLSDDSVPSRQVRPA
jgi:DNA-directed RNA polymerase specialized sigma24 family protein